MEVVLYVRFQCDKQPVFDWTLLYMVQLLPLFCNDQNIPHDYGWGKMQLTGEPRCALPLQN